MKFKNLKLIDRIIIVCFLTAAIFLLGFWWNTKRTNHDYYLPSEGFEGWVTVVHSKPDAKPLALKDGAYQVQVPASGYVETATPLEQGWSRNRFFAPSGSDFVQIPNKHDTGGELMTRFHRHEFYHFSHQDILEDLPVGTDTILWDGTHIIKYAEDDIVYNQGVKTVEFIYIAREPKPVTFNPPRNENDVSDKPLREANQ